MAIIKKAQTKTQVKVSNLIYSDMFTNLDVHPNKLDLALHYNEDSVIRSIRNILLTDRGEKLFNPLFGSDIRALLFEHFSPQTESDLKHYIQLAIGNYEPRVNLIDVIVSALPDESAYVVTITFSVINRSDPITIDILLNRIR